MNRQFLVQTGSLIPQAASEPLAYAVTDVASSRHINVVSCNCRITALQLRQFNTLLAPHQPHKGFETPGFNRH